jgi:hypothetical protein
MFTVFRAEDGGSMTLCNTEVYLLFYTASKPMRTTQFTEFYILTTFLSIILCNCVSQVGSVSVLQRNVPTIHITGRGRW